MKPDNYRRNRSHTVIGASVAGAAIATGTFSVWFLTTRPVTWTFDGLTDAGNAIQAALLAALAAPLLTIAGTLLMRTARQNASRDDEPSQTDQT